MAQSDKPLSSIKCRDLPEYLRNSYLLKKDTGIII